MVKRYSFLAFAYIFIQFLPHLVQAQSFEAGLRNYEQGNYKQAAATFSKINTPQAKLFTAKSYYAIGQFNEAGEILSALLQDAPRGIYYEAAYTLSIIDFQQKQYADALVKLYTVFTDSQIRSLADDANDFYSQIINYLSAAQRLEAINKIKPAEIKYDLVEAALGKVPFSSLKKLIAQFYESVEEKKWQKKVQDIESTLSSEPAYKIEYGNNSSSLTPPDGTVYNIGIALPKVSTEEPTYSVVQGLYLGARLAASQFNESHSDVRVYLTFLPTGSGNLDNLVESYARNMYGDLIIGPLFSEQAGQMVPLSAEHSMPIIAPLATADLATGSSSFYQANSSFAVHGKAMAQFAVKQLGYDTFAVITGENTNGKKSAEAFRIAAEALGATVVSFQIEDFEKNKYDISAYVKKIGSGRAKIDAIYAPFTSNYTPYLVEQLINTANTSENPMTLLGSQKWGGVDFSNDIYARSDVYYSTNSFRNGNLNEFQYRYRRSFNTNPNKYAVIGYDVARYILQLLDKAGNPALLNEAMKQSSLYKGLIKNIYFNGTHINQAVQILKIGNGGRAVLVSGS